MNEDIYKGYYKSNKQASEHQGQMVVNPFFVQHEAAKQEREFIKEMFKTMSPEQIKRFCFENGYAVPTPEELKKLIDEQQS